MSTLPTGFAQLTLAFGPLFSKRVFPSVQVLLFGAILAIGKRTVTSVLRVMGLDQQVHFQTYHRVLNRAAWSPLAASRILLRLLVRAFAPHGPLVFGLDDTIERRWGARIAARGIYRDLVRSSRSHFVKVSGLRWLCMMLLVPIPWAARVWALPFSPPCAPPNAITSGWTNGTSPSPIGRVKWSNKSGDGCQDGALSSWPTVRSPHWIFLTQPGSMPPSLPACAWMPLCMRPRLLAIPNNADAPAKRESGCLH